MTAAAALLAMFAAAIHAQPPIAGRVIDQDGKPAPDAWVYLIRHTHPELPPRFAACLGDEDYVIDVALTDARGRFELPTDGSWPMTIYARHAHEALSPLRFPVLPGDFTELTLRPVVVLGGKLNHAGGRPRPLRGASVEVKVRAAHEPDPALWNIDLTSALPFVRLRTRTDGYGAYSFHVPPASHYETLRRDGGTLVSVNDHEARRPRKLRIRSRGEPVPGVRVIDLSLPAVPRPANDKGDVTLANAGRNPLLVVSPRHKPVLLEDDGDHDQQLVGLSPGYRLRARLLAPRGDPLAGARLVFARTFSRGPMKPKTVAAWAERTDDEGRIDLLVIEPGETLIGFAEVDGRFARFFFRTPADVDLDLGDVTVSAGYEIRGQVTAADRTPAAGAWVFARPVLPPPDAVLESYPMKLAFSRALITDRGGRFVAEGMAPGDRELLVRARRHCIARLTTVAQTTAEPISIQLKVAPFIRGVVLDVDGVRVPGAHILLRQISKPRFGGERLVYRMVECDDDGSFELSDLPDGLSYMLQATDQRGDAHRQATISHVRLDGEPIEIIVR